MYPCLQEHKVAATLALFLIINYLKFQIYQHIKILFVSVRKLLFKSEHADVIMMWGNSFAICRFIFFQFFVCYV